MKKILTVPLTEDENSETYLATGNEYVSIPQISADGIVERIGVILADHSCLYEFVGKELLRPYVTDGGEALPYRELSQSYDCGWIPDIKIGYEKLDVSYKICSPASYKGFVYKTSYKNSSPQTLNLRCGLMSKLDSAEKTVYHSHPATQKMQLQFDEWTKTLVYELQDTAAVGISADAGFQCEYDAEKMSFDIYFEFTLEPGETKELCYYISANIESDGASTVNVDLRRRSGEKLVSEMESWLVKRKCKLTDSRIEAAVNRNMFFCLFYSTARALDTEELLLMTSRSGKYYVSAAFWARDLLLWSFPALMRADVPTAKEALICCFTKYLKNAGIHSLYLNGTVLYPGFELDELVSYIIALERYVRLTQDKSIMENPAIKNGILYILDLLNKRFDSSAKLYETELDPSDDPVKNRFLTYDNVLVWKTLSFLSDFGYETGKKASFLKNEIMKKCVTDDGGKKMFAWSADGQGGFEIYDDPPGSLLMLPYYGFCSKDDEIYKNTCAWILSGKNPYYFGDGRYASAGSEHSPFPWLMSLCNRALSCHKGSGELLAVMSELPLDCGFACESYYIDSGKAKTGRAFATCAGYFANALLEGKFEKEGAVI